MKKGLALLLATCLILTLFQGLAVAETSQELSRLNISSKSYISLEALQVLNIDEESVVSFSLEIHNGDTSDIQMIDYWVRLKSKSGGNYKVVQLDEATSVQPGTSKVFQFASQVKANLLIKDLMVELIKWDFSQPNYEKRIGVFQMPASYTGITSKGASKMVDLNSKISLSVKNYTLQQLQDMYQGNLEVEVASTSSKTVSLTNNLKYYLQTKEGYLYEFQSSESEITLQPNMKKTMTLTNTFPVTSDTKNLNMVLAKTANKIATEIPIALFDLSDPTIEGNDQGSKDVQMIKVETEMVESAVVSASADRNDIQLMLELTNHGVKNVVLKNYIFELLTDDGLTYPVVSSENTVSLDPRIKQELELSSTVANLANKKSLTLKLNKVDDENNKVPVANYSIPSPEKLSYKFGFTYKGNYGFNLNSFQRLPHEEFDVLSAEILVTNKSLQVQPLVNFTGYFVIDGVKYDEQPVELVSMDQVLNLKGLSTARYIIYTKIPYTYEYSNVQLVLREKLDENKETTIVQIDRVQQYEKITSYAQSKEWLYQSAGSSSQIKILNANTYASRNTNLVYVEMEYENQEKRARDMSQLVANFVTEDDLYFTAETSSVNTRIMPNGKGLVQAWTILPSGYNVTDLDLVLGFQVKGQDNVMANAIKYKLSKENKRVSTAVAEHKIGPYQLDLNSIKGEVEGLGAQSIKLLVDYSLEQNYYQYYPEKHQLVVEIIDDELKFSQELDFEGNFLLGDRQKASINVNFSNLKENIDGFYDYQINIYDQFKGHKKLIASETLYWIWYVR